MLSLFDLALLMLFAAFAAWLWRGYGIREVALKLARRHCEKLDIELLDENVALRGLRLLRDSHGRLRLARDYNFEFTVTGDQRLAGSIRLFGHHLARIELQPHPFNPGSGLPGNENPPHADIVKSAQVVQLADWRREHAKPDQSPH
jgi:hypothetical protein